MAISAPPGWTAIGSATVTAASPVLAVGPITVPQNGRIVVVTRQTGPDPGFKFGYVLLRFIPDGNEPGAVLKVWGTSFWCLGELGPYLTPGCSGSLSLEPRSVNLVWARNGEQLQLEVAAAL